MGRNAFESLCELASKENWCWRLSCTTCGQVEFRYAFRELASGKNPDSEDWTVKKFNGDYYRKHIDSPAGGLTEKEQEVLVDIVADCDLNKVALALRKPDWLGYIGVVITACPDENVRLANALWPKFNSLIENKYGSSKELFPVGPYLMPANLEQVEYALYQTNI